MGYKAGMVEGMKRRRGKRRVKREERDKVEARIWILRYTSAPRTDRCAAS